MNREDIGLVLEGFKGSTFVGLDVETKANGVRKIETGIAGIIFSRCRSSGYEKMVKRRLEAMGRNPDNFVLSDLPWGERVCDTSVITHNGEDYLQVIVLRDGDVSAFIGVSTPYPIKVSERTEIVKVRTYKLSSITAIRLLGEELK